MMMLTYTGSLIEDHHPYVILWLLKLPKNAWLLCIASLEEKETFKEYRRQALNYGIVVEFRSRGN